MKLKIAVTLLLSQVILFSAMAQVINVPKKSEEHFANKYPKASDIDWTNNVVDYTAKFKLRDGSYKAYYKIDGSWDYTVKYLTEKELPEAVKSAVDKSRISDWEPLSAAYIETHKGVKEYRVERKKGIEKKYIFYDKNGKELKSSLSI